MNTFERLTRPYLGVPVTDYMKQVVKAATIPWLAWNMIRHRPSICVVPRDPFIQWDEQGLATKKLVDHTALLETIESSTERFAFMFATQRQRFSCRAHMTVVVFDTVDKCAWNVDSNDGAHYLDPDPVDDILERIVHEVGYEWMGRIDLDANMDGDCLLASATFALVAAELGCVHEARDYLKALGRPGLRELYDGLCKTWIMHVPTKNYSVCCIFQKDPMDWCQPDLG